MNARYDRIANTDDEAGPSSQSATSGNVSPRGPMAPSGGENRPAAGWTLTSVAGGAWNALRTGLLGGEEESITPATRARAFLERLRSKYALPAAAALPAFSATSYSEALQRSDRECKPMLVYLHSDIHEDSWRFVASTLAHAPLVAFLNANFVTWAASVHAVDGFEAAARFDASGFPFVGVYSATPQSTPLRPKYQRVWASEAFESGPDLLAKLRLACGAALTSLETLAAERQNRDYERRLRDDQDREYREAEAADEARLQSSAAAAAAEAVERARSQAEAAELQSRSQAEAAAAEEAAELAAAIALSKELCAESDLAAAAARLEAHPEPPPPAGAAAATAAAAAAAGGAFTPAPPAAATEVSSLRFTLPSGARLQRRFDARADTLQTVRDYVAVASAALGPAHALHRFDLGTTYPRRAFPEAAAAADAGTTLRAAGLYPQAMVFVTQTAPQAAAAAAACGSAAANNSAR